jgi:transposase-like protein
MNIIHQAKEFVQRLLNPNDPRRCPYCGKRMTKKNGSYEVTIRDLDGRGAHRERCQRRWCHLCHKSYSGQDPRRAKHARYTRRVQRKGLDMYFHLGGSLRRTTEFLRSEINGTERTRIWDPLARSQPEPQPAVKLSHTTLWRWEQRAGHQARQHQRANLWQGVLRFSGALVADGSGVAIRGVGVPVHLISDAVSRVVLRLQRLPQESDLAILGQFRAALKTWELRVEAVKVLVSDGASGYQYVMAEFLRQAGQQRSLFHLWRNVLPAIKTYQAKVGQELAKQFRAGLKAVWEASSLAAAQELLAALKENWAKASQLNKVWFVVDRTLTQALTHTLGLVKGIERSNTVAERFFRRYKQRLRPMGGFMSVEGCDNFNALWMVYFNFEPYQVRKERKKRYCHPGRCPLEIGEVDAQGLTWLDVVGI